MEIQNTTEDQQPMKILLRVIVWACLVFLMLGATRGQTDTTPDADVSGRWLGAFDIVHQGGAVEPANAVFILKQNGSALTGTAGQSQDKLTPLSDGEVTNQTVRFTVLVHQNVAVKFNLKLEGDHLRGEATGLPGVEPGSKIVVNVTRWPESATAPEITHVADGLFATVSALDKKLFDAYNRCDLATMSAMVDDGLEFYHDHTGLTVGKQPFLDAIKNNICGQTQRTLVPGSLEVYPLKDYGAVEIGVHRFTHPGHPELGEGEAKFVTLWQNKNGTWKISRAISFDHENVKQ